MVRMPGRVTGSDRASDPVQLVGHLVGQLDVHVVVGAREPPDPHAEGLGPLRLGPLGHGPGVARRRPGAGGGGRAGRGRPSTAGAPTGPGGSRMWRSNVSHGRTVPSSRTSKLARVASTPASSHVGWARRRWATRSAAGMPARRGGARARGAVVPVGPLVLQLDRPAVDADHRRHPVGEAEGEVDGEVAAGRLAGDARAARSRGRRGPPAGRRPWWRSRSRRRACRCGRGPAGRSPPPGGRAGAGARPPPPTCGSSRPARGRGGRARRRRRPTPGRAARRHRRRAGVGRRDPSHPRLRGVGGGTEASYGGRPAIDRAGHGHTEARGAFRSPGARRAADGRARSFAARPIAWRSGVRGRLGSRRVPGSLSS